MSTFYPYQRSINLHVKGRISPADAQRQEETAKAILQRLANQPGVILADEVGMGKTFVALAVAVSVAVANKGRRPVVVMVPPSLRDKWPTDFETFRQRCLTPELAAEIRCGHAERAVEFLKLLDDPIERRKQIIFVTHGAMSRGLGDKWVMLAMIYQAVKGRWESDRLRRSLARFAGDLLNLHEVDRAGEQAWVDLLKTHPSQWLDLLRKWGVDPDGNGNPDMADDPVPRTVYEVLPGLNTDAIYRSLEWMPRRRTKHYSRNLSTARHVLKRELREVWKICLRRLSLRLPLLVLDEAHHLKNPGTRLASLFHAPEARDDADEVSRGELAGVFTRMLFLTATPFQLGHSELCSVLQRFDGVDWTGRRAPSCGKQGYGESLNKLRQALDDAQESTVALDTAWGRLRNTDLGINGRAYGEVSEWWAAAQSETSLTPTADHVRRSFAFAQKKMKEAEQLLRPWVIRHLKPRHLPEPFQNALRRRVLSGRAILGDGPDGDQTGLIVNERSVLPFLLAARAAFQSPDSRPVFAEGLASSYEAFLHTRQLRQRDASETGDTATDADDDDGQVVKVTDLAALWYLDQLERFIPKDDAAASASHPKIAATVKRATEIWEGGEKVLVFCHFVATGRTLRQRISEAIEQRIAELGAQKLDCAVADVPEQLEKLGKRFFDEDSPIRRACDAEAVRLIDEYEELRPHREQLVGVIRRNLRTPSFLVRFFQLEKARLRTEDVAVALKRADPSGITLEQLLQNFLRFLVERCGEVERGRYIEAVSRIQTGSHAATDLLTAFDEDELQGMAREKLVPNVRLVNGATTSITRQRLMLSFNTPFYPEVLVASSVMAEGVDLHLNCRHIIHHDLCWNPSTLEQRTGRVDRIGAKAELCGVPIEIYLPFIAETQDEKQYRVVMDRERWFSVVMGERYKIDLRTAEALAQRLPFPESAAAALAFRLEVAGTTAPVTLLQKPEAEHSSAVLATRQECPLPQTQSTLASAHSASPPRTPLA